MKPSPLEPSFCLWVGYNAPYVSIWHHLIGISGSPFSHRDLISSPCRSNWNFSHASLGLDWKYSLCCSLFGPHAGMLFGKHRDCLTGRKLANNLESLCILGQLSKCLPVSLAQNQPQTFSAFSPALCPWSVPSPKGLGDDFFFSLQNVRSGGRLMGDYWSCLRGFSALGTESSGTESHFRVSFIKAHHGCAMEGLGFILQKAGDFLNKGSI